MDCSGCCFNPVSIRNYFPHLPLLYLYPIRNRLPFLFLYAEIRHSAFNFIADYSTVLLPQATSEKDSELSIYVVFVNLRNRHFVPVDFFYKRPLPNIAFRKLADFTGKRFAVI